MASKSRRPALRRPLKMTHSSWSTSCAISWWTSPGPFFFLRARRYFLYRPQPADLFTHLHKGAAQLLIFAELRDFVLSFPHGGRGGQRLADRFALHLVSETQGGAVAGIVRLGALTPRFATATQDSSHRSGTKVAEPGELGDKFRTLLFKIG
jgi:hypothetical protein